MFNNEGISNYKGKEVTHMSFGNQNNSAAASNSNSILTVGGSGSAVSNANGNLVFSAAAGSWQVLNTESNLEDIFINMVKDLAEDQVSAMLDTVKRMQPSNYGSCLLSLVSYPNFKQMSEKFMVDRYEDINAASKSRSGREFDYAKIYGRLLDAMPALKLLIEMKK